MSNNQETPKTSRGKTLLAFFKKTQDKTNVEDNDTHRMSPNVEEPFCSRTLKIRKVDVEKVNASDCERDPGLRKPIWSYDVNRQDEIRRTYIAMGPYQPFLSQYPKTYDGNQYRRFQSSWFSKFPWLEYSTEKNKAYCFPCFLFDKNPLRFPIYTVEGFANWKRVNNGNKCSFLTHVGEPNSVHNQNMQNLDSLKNPSHHIAKVISAQSLQQVLQNRLRLKTTIGVVKWLAMQACAFRGHDESSESSNRGNFIELLKYTAALNEDINKVVLDNAPGNAKYMAPTIQKEILSIIADRVRRKIREEIGDSKYCILVDEALDDSHKEQMAIILRFVDCHGFIQERFFDVVEVEDTTAVTLKKGITEILMRYDLQIENMRGQGYDGVSNMRGSYNGLQALFLKECPYAYYVHCFAHRLQLALVAASKDVHHVWLFFSKLSSIINVLISSPKRHRELKLAREIELVEMLESGELETGIGANQTCTLQRPGATRWSSHFVSVSSLIKMFGSAITTLEKMIQGGIDNSAKGEALGALTALRNFDFVFILHLIYEVMNITDHLCRSLQLKSQDIVNAMENVSRAKKRLLELRKNGWNSFLENVIAFCIKHEINVPDMNARYMDGTGLLCQQGDFISFGHHYEKDIFNEVIDFQRIELNSRFTDKTMELLTLSSSLSPAGAFRSFNIEGICTLAEKFYPQDFTRGELCIMRSQLSAYEDSVCRHPDFQNMSSMSELCQKLVETERSPNYYLVDRLIRLVLTLPVSTATTERAFSAMKLIKTLLRNKMDGDFLADNMVVYIERDIAKSVDLDTIIDDFDLMKSRRTQFSIV